MSDTANAKPAFPAERRYLTIVFSDLSNFTELSEQLDPEELLELRDKYQRLALTIVERYGGFVSNFAGDGVLSYFGYPTAHENDAERAVRASLELVDAVSKLDLSLPSSPGLGLRARVGLHTGIVLMAPEQASGGMLEHAVVGQAVNLAARLEQLAEPDTIVLSKATLELVEGLFETQSLGFRPVKGLSKPIAVHRVLRARQGSGRSSARFRRGGTRMIGRSSNLDQIRDEWAGVLSSERLRAVFVVGEAGLGKTRLAMEFLRHAELHSEAVLQINCHEIFSKTPLYPAAGILWAGAGLTNQDSEEVRLAKSRSYLQGFGLRTEDHLQTFTRLLESFGIPQLSGSREVPLDLKKRQFALLLALLGETAKREPAVLWVEDAHWLDPSSIELLREVAHELERTPILLLITTRPPVPEGLSFPVDGTTIELAPLSTQECLELASSVPGAKALPAQLLEQAVTLADGSPLFMEQLTLALIDGRDQSSKGTSPPAVLPLTLAEMISERLDRIRDGRRIVQLAACLGSAFTGQFLEGLLDEKPNQTVNLLDQLVKAEILRVSNRPGRYEFRHALLRRAAYDLMTQAARRAAHARIAQALMTRPQGTVLPEVLAHHLSEAALFKEATTAWLQAAGVAARRFAYVEAIAHAERGLGLVEQIADVDSRRALEIGLQASLIGPITATVGATYDKVLTCCQRGLQLCGAGPQNPLVFAFLFGQFTHAICRANTPLAATSANLFLQTANQAKYESGQVIGYRMTGMVQAGRGDLAGAVESLNSSLSLYRHDRDEAATHVFGQNTQVHSRSLLSFSLMHAGRVEEAIGIGVDALASIDKLKHPHSSALALGYVGGWVFGLCGFTEQLMQASRQLVALAEQHNIRNMRRFGQAFIGWAHCQSGDLAQGIDNLQQAISDLEAVGFMLTLPGHMSVLADAMRRSGDHDRAEALCRRALEIIEQGGERLHESQVRRVRAQIAADLRASPDEIESLFRAAVASAEAVNSPLLEYRALRAMSEATGASKLDASARSRLDALSFLGSIRNHEGLLSVNARAAATLQEASN